MEDNAGQTAQLTRGKLDFEVHITATNLPLTLTEK